MKIRTALVWQNLVLGICAVEFAARAQTSVTNFVTNMGIIAYRINGTNNPPLTLQRGITYVFQVNTFGHSFAIKTNALSGPGHRYNEGVTNQGEDIGSVIFAVPASAPGNLFYQCEEHQAMGGTLTIIDPPAPPTVQIVFLSVSQTGVVLKSTGASNWNAIPEFSSNLTSAVWLTVPNYTNVFSSGTNTTTFNRLDPISGPNVFLRVRNQPN